MVGFEDKDTVKTQALVFVVKTEDCGGFVVKTEDCGGFQDRVTA